jgi:maltooligosyltrehalose trehalohydrolase
MTHYIPSEPEKNLPGVHFPPGETPVVRVWAPRARQMAMEIDGKKNIRLQKKGDGWWEVSCPELQHGDRYVFCINGRSRYPDPASLSQPVGVHGPSACVDLNEIRKIREVTWQGIAMRDLVIYELHVGTFTPRGTFRAIEGKLAYLKELGINAIEIMPVAAFPGNRNWGYDGVFPYAVQNGYGGPLGLARLIRACHRHGIAVILDVVYNHLGPEGNCLPAFGQYLSTWHKTPWGKSINFDGEGSEEVRRYFLQNALMWLRDFHVDGLRLDAVQAIVDESPVHFLQELSQQVRALNEASGSRHFLIGESDLNDTRYIESAEKGGYGLHAQWSDDWHHALHALLTGESRGYYSDFGQLSQMVKAFNQGFVYDGVYSPYRSKVVGTPAKGQPPERFVVYTQNHDQVGNRLKGERLGMLVDFESLKLAAGALLASPFVPMLFMGEELAADSPFLFFIDHGDPSLVERVRRGRKREFREFFGKGQPPDPAAPESFLQSRLNWDFSGSTRKNQMLAFYKKLIELRKEFIAPETGKDYQAPKTDWDFPGQQAGRNAPGHEAGRRDHIRAEATPCRKGVIFHQGKGVMPCTGQNHHPITVIMNFSGEEMVVDIRMKSAFSPEPACMPEVLVYSAHRQWGGPVDDRVVPFLETNGSLQVKTAGRSALFLRFQ